MLQTRNAKRPAQAAVRFAVDAVAEGLLDARGGAADDRRREARRAAAPDVRPRRRLRRCSRAAWRRRPARRRARSSSPPTTRWRPPRGPRRDPRAPVHRGRRRRRLPRGQGHPDQRGRQGVARGARGARDGRAGGDGRGDAGDRPRGAARCAWTATRAARGRPDRDRRHDGRDHHRRRAARRARDRASTSAPCWAGPTSCARSACARTPTRRRTPRSAREFGAEGIGLCRTEHMFFGEDRHDEDGRGDPGRRRRGAPRCLDELLPLQQGDFEGIFAAMEGLPVTIRLLDPPLHEFLPTAARRRAARSSARGSSGPRTCGARAHAASACGRCEEANPMLGTRGCRLGILYPEIYEMQVEAIFARAGACASARRERRGRDHGPAGRLRARARAAARARRARRRARRDASRRGLPDRHDDRAAAGVLRWPTRSPTQADFFSFGTNDLTQTALGLLARRHRGRILGALHRHEDPRPLAVRDARRARGRPARAMGAWLGRKTKPALKLGVCGEHGGDPDSIDVLPPLGHRLRVVLALPRAGGARGRRPGRGARRPAAPATRPVGPIPYCGSWSRCTPAWGQGIRTEAGAGAQR